MFCYMPGARVIATLGLFWHMVPEYVLQSPKIVLGTGTTQQTSVEN